MDWSELRAREFPRLSGAFLDSAYFGPLPERSRAAAERALAEASDPSSLVYEEWRERPEAVRALVARLVRCPVDDVAVVTSTTEIVNRIAQGLVLAPGDRVAVIEGDYPSIVIPWLLREPDGVVVDRLVPPSPPVDAAWLDAHMAKETRVLALSHVAFDTGARIDLAAVSALCARRRIELVVDATQALGALEIDLGSLEGVSALAVSTYKWLLGPYGTAFGVVRPRLLARMKPRWLNWLTTRNASRADDLLRYTTETLAGARALDRGQTASFVPLAMQRASLELFLDLGPGAIASRGRALADRLVAGLDRSRYDLATPEHARANIVSFKTRGKTSGLEERLRAARIKVSVREGKLRVSPHFFNTEAEIDRLLEVLAS
jgi:selenocysteine lyase/cysteine desulfurase